MKKSEYEYLERYIITICGVYSPLENVFIEEYCKKYSKAFIIKEIKKLCNKYGKKWLWQNGEFLVTG